MLNIAYPLNVRMCDVIAIRCERIRLAFCRKSQIKNSVTATGKFLMENQITLPELGIEPRSLLQPLNYMSKTIFTKVTSQTS